MTAPARSHDASKRPQATAVQARATPRAPLAPLSRRLFDRWVDFVGGTEDAADACACSITMISHLRNGQRKPGRELAARIEKASTAWKPGPVRATRWDK